MPFVQSNFDEGFTKKLTELPVNAALWQGPIKSPLGYPAVLFFGKEKSAIKAFLEVKFVARITEGVSKMVCRNFSFIRACSEMGFKLGLKIRIIEKITYFCHKSLEKWANNYLKMTRQEFQNIALLRQAESKSLLKRKHYDGCCYLAGYSLEVALKAAICQQMKNDSFFDIIRPETARAFKIHNLGELVILAGLSQEYENLKNTNLILWSHWAFIRDNIRWSEQLRYQIGVTKEDAEQMILAISEPKNGILKWIKKHW